MHYHRNAKTNISQRKAIKENRESARRLAEQYLVSHATTAKWKKVGHLEDKSHRPDIIHYAVSQEYWTLIKKSEKKLNCP